MGLLDPPGLSRSAFQATALTLLRGTFDGVWVNGHSAAAGVGGTSGLPGSGGGRLASSLLKCPIFGNPLGGAVLSLQGVEVDPSGGGLTNVNTGVGGYARALKDFAPGGLSTLNAGISSSATTLVVDAITDFTRQFPFEVSFTPPSINGVTITGPAAPMLIQVDNELMYVTAVDAGAYSSNRTFTVTRAVLGTARSSHAAGVPVIQIKGRKGLNGLLNEQTSRPYTQWPINAPMGFPRNMLPFLWWDLNDFFMHCSTSFGGMTLTGNSIANYDATRRCYISTYRRVISRARAAMVCPAPYARAAYEAVAALPAGSLGIYGSTGAAGATGGWGDATFIDATQLRKSTWGMFVTNTAGDFAEYNSQADLSQDQAVAFGGVVANGDTGLLTFSVDGTTVGTIDLSQVAPPSINSASAWCFRFTEAVLRGVGKSLVGASHRFRCTLTTAAGAGKYGLKLDSVDVESGQQGFPILTAGGFRPLDTAGIGIDAGGNAFASSLSDRTTKIAQIASDVDALRAEFAPYSGLPNPVLKVDVDAALGVDPAKRNADMIHPNNAGYNAIATNAAFVALTNYLLAARDPASLLSA